MKQELSCPVCAYTEITGNSCPNCDADLSVIRLLTELPLETQIQQKTDRWRLGAALLLLLLGIGLGVGGSWLFFQPSIFSVTTIKPPISVAVKRDRLVTLPIARKPQLPQYTVKAGDNLSAIADRFCGKGKSWQVMLKANPQLNTRSDSIDIGEVLKLPNCEE
jgi:LysM domain